MDNLEHLTHENLIDIKELIESWKQDFSLFQGFLYAMEFFFYAIASVSIFFATIYIVIRIGDYLIDKLDG